MSDHLRRLRLHVLSRCIPKTHRYRLTSFGLRTILFCTRAYTRVFRTGLGAISPTAAPISTPLHRSFDKVEREIDSWMQQVKIAA